MHIYVPNDEYAIHTINMNFIYENKSLFLNSLSNDMNLGEGLLGGI